MCSRRNGTKRVRPHTQKSTGFFRIDIAYHEPGSTVIYSKNSFDSFLLCTLHGIGCFRGENSAILATDPAQEGNTTVGRCGQGCTILGKGNCIAVRCSGISNLDSAQCVIKHKGHVICILSVLFLKIGHSKGHRVIFSRRRYQFNFC